jgi:hypothetical protein
MVECGIGRIALVDKLRSHYFRASFSLVGIVYSNIYFMNMVYGEVLTVMNEATESHYLDDDLSFLTPA